MFQRLTRPTLLTLVALLGFSLTMPALARRGAPVDAEGPSEDQIAIRQLRQEIAAEELAVALTLDSAQVDALSALISEAIETRAARKAERQAKATELRDLLDGYLKELRKRGEASAGTVDAIREFREANRPNKGEFRDQRKEVAADLKDILSEDQLVVLRAFRPMSAVGPGPEGGDGDEGRQAHRKQKMNAQGGDKEFGEFRAMKHQRHQRKKTRKVVRHVLFSEAMLAVLQR